MQLSEGCQQAVLDELRAALGDVKEPEFQASRPFLLCRVQHKQQSCPARWDLPVSAGCVRGRLRADCTGLAPLLAAAMVSSFQPVQRA